MAMTPEEMLAFFREQAESSASNLDLPAVRGNPHLFCLNARRSCENHLMSALIAWRHQLDNPIADLRKSLDKGERFVPDLFALDMPVPVHERIRIYDIAFCSIFTGVPLSDELATLLASSGSTADPETALDLSLVSALAATVDILETAISDFSPTPETQLVHDTYFVYSRILSGNTDAVADAVTNFSRRASDGYFSSGLQIDGGGQDNAHTIDYRLAAIIHTLGLTVPTIHKLPIEI